ncbi:hypothetical protein ACFWVP_20070 [Streptomyces sp. NPDC058637]|uniref:hypothetical protein n=1 Tax=Streptomyces sp. NPDC058637 TaxID=3346569 RepID=UPI00364B2829
MKEIAQKFTELVLKIAEDPSALARFREDATGTMEGAGLTPAEQTVLASGERLGISRDKPEQVAKAAVKVGQAAT